MKNKIICVTGHRNIPDDKIEYVRTQLLNEIQSAINDGYTTFISGFADGADLLFAECVLEHKKEYPNLFLEAAIPYANRIKNGNAQMRDLLRKCGSVKFVCNEYQPDSFMLRNRYMVQQSSRVVAVYDGRDSGGTVFTMRYATLMEKELRIIEY